MRNVYVLAVVLALAPVCARAQWLHYAVPGTPRTPDGKPDLAAPAPRTPDGKPDLSGIWQAEGSPIQELIKLLPGGGNGLGEDVPSKYFINLLADFQGKEELLRPSEVEAYRQRAASFGKDGPITHCLPAGVPMGETQPGPFKIIQTPAVIAVLYEAQTSFRQIFVDGRKLPVDPDPAWLGYSVGRWEGDTLLVDSAGFNDKTWLDAFGHTHSDALRVTERFRRRNFGHLDVQVTIDDPKTYTKPFTAQFTEALRPDTDLIESICGENEKDASHLAGR